MYREYSNTKNESINAATLADAMGAKRSGLGYLTRCPAHGDRTPSLFFKDGDKAILFKCFAGCSGDEVVEALRNRGDWSGDKTWQAPTLKQDEEEARRKQQQKAQSLWHTASEIEPGDPVHRYLTETRRLNLSHIPTDLRIAPSLEYWTVDDDAKPRLVTKTPALLAAVRGLSGELLALHRTYLSTDGTKFKPEAYGMPASAPVKKVVGSIGGGAIHLHEPGDTLLVAEGLETALAAHILSGYPAWAAVSAGNMERIEIPSEVKTLIICVDNDEAGERASAKLARRLRNNGIEAMLSIPGLIHPQEGTDWADIVNREVA